MGRGSKGSEWMPDSYTDYDPPTGDFYYDAITTDGNIPYYIVYDKSIFDSKNKAKLINKTAPNI